MKNISHFLFLISLISACASNVSRRTRPTWIVEPLMPKNDQIFFVGKAKAEDLAQGEKEAILDAIEKIFLYLGFTAELDQKQLLERLTGLDTTRIKKTRDLIEIKATTEKSVQIELADWYWKRDQKNYEVWVLIKTKRGELEEARLAQKAEEEEIRKKLSDFLSKAEQAINSNNIVEAVRILAGLDQEKLTKVQKILYESLVAKATENLKIEKVKETEEEITFKVISRGNPLSVPVICRVGEQVNNEWSDAGGYVRCPKSLTPKLTVQILPPLGPKTIVISPIRVALIKTENQENEHFFEKFQEILEKKINVRIIKVPNNQMEEIKIALAKTTPEIKLILLLDDIESRTIQNYDPNDPANFYYATKMTYKTKVKATARLVSLGLDSYNEIIVKSSTAERTALNQNEAQIGAVVACAETLALEFLEALKKIEE